MNKKNIISLVMVVAMVGLTIFGVKPTTSKKPSKPSTPAASSYADGTYEGTGTGFGGDVSAEVTVSGGKITAVTLTGDSETPTIGGAALEELQDQIVTANGAQIDGVAGATYTSNGVKEAIEAALANAATTTGSASLTDGTYEGTGTGFGGDVTAKITVEGGKITTVELTGDSETPTIGGAALEELQEQIIEANGAEIDGVSGATRTSNGVSEAVADALS